MGATIKQTNRTMLLEMLNPEKMDFLTLVGDVRGMESLSDDKIKEIEEAIRRDFGNRLTQLREQRWLPRRRIP